MVLVNACVITTSKQHYLHWTILSVDNELWSIKDFFEHSVKPRMASTVKISSVTACMGSDKLSLDSVDINIQLVLVIQSFGHFLKYIIDLEPDSSTAAIEMGLSELYPLNSRMLRFGVITVMISYYSAKYEPICVNCGTVASFTNNKSLPKCSSCHEKPSK